MLKNGRSIMPKRKRKSTSKDNDFNKKLFDCLEIVQLFSVAHAKKLDL